MSDCRARNGYRTIFSVRSAQSEAKRCRRKGPDEPSRRIANSRFDLCVVNLRFREFHVQFQVFLHRPESILAEAERDGPRSRLNDRGLAWQVMVFETRDSVVGYRDLPRPSSPAI